MRINMKTKLIWTKENSLAGDSLFYMKDIGSPYVHYWEDRHELCISEYGKHFDDHAVVTFKCNSIKEAEFIVTRLKKLVTA